MANKPKKTVTEDRVYTLSGLDATVLLIHIIQGAKHPEVGFEDVQNTRGRLRSALDVTVEVPQSILESALWSANLMDEVDSFWHPDGLTFDEFVKQLSDEKFDRLFNVFENRSRTQ